MTELLEQVLRKVADLPREDQDAIASQIIETLEDESHLEGKIGASSGKIAPPRRTGSART